jgi:hypothetical protein
LPKSLVDHNTERGSADEQTIPSLTMATRRKKDFEMATVEVDINDGGKANLD